MGVKGLSLKLKDEMLDIKKFHSVSPQYLFYSSRFIRKLDSLIYRELLESKDYEYLVRKLHEVNDTTNLHTFLGIESILKIYKPRLGEFDLLYSTDISTIKVLHGLSVGIIDTLQRHPSYLPSLEERIKYLINCIRKVNDTKDNSNREVYYHLATAKNALVTCSNVHYNSYLTELTDMYKELYNYVIDTDKEFYNLFEYKNKDEEVENGYSDYTDVELTELNVMDCANSIKPSTSFSGYTYVDFLKDKNEVLCDLIQMKSNGVDINEINSKILNSSMDSGFKHTLSNELYSVRTYYIEQFTNPSTVFYWYNELQDDFIYHCSVNDIEEGYQIAQAIVSITEHDSLVEYAVQQSTLLSIADDRDKDTFNKALKEILFKFYTYDLLDDYKEIYNEYKI